MSLYSEIARIQAAGERAALCTIVRAHGSTPRRAGSKMLVYPDGHFSGTIGGGQMEHRVVQEALAAMADGKPRLLTYELTDPGRGDPGVCGGQLEVYVEPILAQATVVVYGVGHVGRAVVHLAKWLGMRVVAADDREGFTDAAPEADEHLTVAPAALAAALTITPQTYLVLTTRNVDVDLDALPPLLDSAAAYIGIIGSKRRWETARKQLLERGVPKEQLDRVVSPMGVEIHAETPEEIAVSILGEIIAKMRG